MGEQDWKEASKQVSRREATVVWNAYQVQRQTDMEGFRLCLDVRVVRKNCIWG